MKKYTSFLFVFTLFIILLGFNANSTSADNCASGELFNTTTGKACSTAKAVVCPAGDLFSLVTGQRCTAVSGNSSQQFSSASPLTINQFVSLYKNGFFIGAKGDDVKALQQFLKDQGYYSGKVDGNYGKISAQAVKDFKGNNISYFNSNSNNQIPSITILSPNGGEKWNFGQSQTIKWDSKLPTGNVDIYLYNLDSSGAICKVGSAPASSGNFIFAPGLNIPCSSNTQLIPGQYRVKLITSGQSFTSNLGAYDVSDSYLTITSSTSTQPSITVLSPNGGETFRVGIDPFSVRWVGTNLVSSDGIKFSIVDANGVVTETNAIEAGFNLRATSGSASLMVPSSIKSGSYRLKITDDYSNSDMSDNYFTIISATSTQSSITNNSYFYSYSNSGSSSNTNQNQQTQTPTIISLSLSSGRAGVLVTVNTLNFTNDPNNSINFMSVNGGGMSFSAIPKENGLIQFNVPDYTAGMYNVNVDSDLNGQSNTVQFNLLATTVSTPTITSLSPSSGRADALVTVNMLNYTDYMNNSINFQSVNGGGTVFSARTNTSGLIQFTVPDYPAGVYNIYVDSDLQGNSNIVQFTLLATIVSTPSITSISPTSGPAGTLVTVNVSNYPDDPDNSLTFNSSTEGKSFLGKATYGKITFTAPNYNNGTYEIQVQNDVNGSSNKFNFQLTPLTSSLPVITSIFPQSGPAGTQVTLDVLNLVDPNSYVVSFSCSYYGHGTLFFTQVNGKVVFTAPSFPPADKCDVDLDKVNDINGTSNIVNFELTAPR